MFEVIGICGVPIYESVSRQACELFCRKRGLDPEVSIVKKEVRL